jgi:hypothetical protein
MILLGNVKNYFSYSGITGLFARINPFIYYPGPENPFSEHAA